MDKKEQVVRIIHKHLQTEAKYLGYDKGYGWNLELIAEEICQLFNPKGEKPPVLSEEQFSEWCQTHQVHCKGECLQVGNTYLCRQEAQRDADVAYYEPLIQQAKEEVAREIFEEIENMELPESPIEMPTDKYDDAVMDERIVFEHGARKYRQKVLAAKSKYLKE